jgi:hypothetical protein
VELPVLCTPNTEKPPSDCYNSGYCSLTCIIWIIANFSSVGATVGIPAVVLGLADGVGEGRGVGFGVG